MNKEWFIIKDLKEFVDSSRRLVFQSFGKNTTEEDQNVIDDMLDNINNCLLYTSPSPRDGLLSRMPSSA